MIIAYHLNVFKQSLVTFAEHKNLIFLGQTWIKTRSLRTGTRNWKSRTLRTSDAWTRYNDRRWRSIADRSCVRLGPWFTDRRGFYGFWLINFIQHVWAYTIRYWAYTVTTYSIKIAEFNNLRSAWRRFQNWARKGTFHSSYQKWTRSLYALYKA